MCHLLRWLGPAEVLGRASTVQSIRVDCSSIYLLWWIYHLKIFFVPFHMEDMKAWVSVGGGCRQKSGSSSSSICSSEELSAGTSLVRTVRVQIEYKHLLYTLVILSGDTNTRSYPKFLVRWKFLHRRITRIDREYFSPLVRWEFVVSYYKMTLFKETVCCLVMRLWIIWSTGLSNDVVWSRLKILRWIHRPMQWTFQNMVLTLRLWSNSVHHAPFKIMN